MSVLTQFRVRIGIHGTQTVSQYTCSEWAWLYAFGYPLKCIAPLFPTSTLNLHSNQIRMSADLHFTTGLRSSFMSVI